MKKRLISFYSIITLSFIFTSCKNDLEVLAPGKEMVSVYGILDATQPVQNIRINKVYVNEHDALISAQDADAINYGPGELIVTLERYLTGGTTRQLTTKGDPSKKEIVLTETVVTTNNGTFNTTQRLWQTTDKLYRDGEYKLIVKRASSGEEIATAQNVILDSVSTAASLAMPFLYYPTNPTIFPNHGNYPLIPISTDYGKYIDYQVPVSEKAIKFKSIKSAELYDVVMRFHYLDSLTDDSTVTHFVDYNFSTIKGNISKINEALSVTFNVADFYTNLSNEINKKGTVSNLKNRKALYMEYIIYAGAESLSDFLEVNAPSTTIATDKPYYTNIKGGVGVFSSKSTSSLSKDLWSEFADKIACRAATIDLKFCDYTTGKPVSLPCP